MAIITGQNQSFPPTVNNGNFLTQFFAFFQSMFGQPNQLPISSTITTPEFYSRELQNQNNWQQLSGGSFYNPIPEPLVDPNQASINLLNSQIQATQQQLQRLQADQSSLKDDKMGEILSRARNYFLGNSNSFQMQRKNSKTLTVDEIPFSKNDPEPAETRRMDFQDNLAMGGRFKWMGGDQEFVQKAVDLLKRNRTLLGDDYFASNGEPKSPLCKGLLKLSEILSNTIPNLQLQLENSRMQMGNLTGVPDQNLNLQGTDVPEDP